MLEYSNPRQECTITDWPYGQYRTTARFFIERDAKKGERGVRTTVDPKTGRVSQPKTLTYAAQACIVDGSDGKTYILELVKGSTHFSIMQGNMQFQQEAIFAGDPRFEGLGNLLRAR
jgi:hypothetical protein